MEKFALVTISVLLGFVAGSVYGVFKSEEARLRNRIVDANLILYGLERIEAGEIQDHAELMKVDFDGHVGNWTQWYYTGSMGWSDTPYFWGDAARLVRETLFGPTSVSQESIDHSMARVHEYIASNPVSFEPDWNCDDIESESGMFLCQLHRTREQHNFYREKFKNEYRTE